MSSSLQTEYILRDIILGKAQEKDPKAGNKSKTAPAPIARGPTGGKSYISTMNVQEA